MTGNTFLVFYSNLLNLEMKKVDHQNAMKRAEYEDQLRQQAKDRNMQRELEMQRKQEELKRRKFFYPNPIYRRKWVFVLFRQFHKGLNCY